MIKRDYIFLSILCITLFLHACEDYQIEKPVVQDEVKFSQDVLPIFVKCTGCHKGSLNPDLRDAGAYNALTNGGYYNVASPENSRIYIQLTTKSSHASLVSELEKAKILQWIALGAKND
jgi:hypothetical protein